VPAEVGRCRVHMTLASSRLSVTPPNGVTDRRWHILEAVKSLSSWHLEPTAG